MLPFQICPSILNVAKDSTIASVGRWRSLKSPVGVVPETPPPTAHTAGAIGLIFGLEVHRVNINGATLAIFEFPSRTPKNQLQMAKISTFAEISKWSISPVWDGNSKIAKVAPFISAWCTSSQKIDSIALVVWAVGGGCYKFRAPHLVIRLFLYRGKSLVWVGYLGFGGPVSGQRNGEILKQIMLDSPWNYLPFGTLKDFLGQFVLKLKADPN